MSYPKKYLEQLRYPANRLEALRHALSRGADDRMVGALRRLPEREYRSLADLEGELDSAHARGRRPAA